MGIDPVDEDFTFFSSHGNQRCNPDPRQQLKTSLVCQSIVLHDAEFCWEVHQGDLLDGLAVIDLTVSSYEYVLQSAHIAEIVVHTAATSAEFGLAIGIFFAL